METYMAVALGVQHAVTSWLAGHLVVGDIHQRQMPPMIVQHDCIGSQNCAQRLTSFNRIG